MQDSQQINSRKIFPRATLKQRKRAAIVLLVFALFSGFVWMAGADKFDINRYVRPCGFKQRHNLPCPTCGMTTSAIAFGQGRIAESFYIQPAGGLLYSIFVVVGFLAFIIAVFGVYFLFLERFFREVKIRHIIWAFLVMIIGGWAVTLVRALS